jgi:dTDP-4-dehydrorhamnose 3,5-epimerase
MTLTDETEAFYLVSSAYAPHSEGGIRYDDTIFQIEWPVEMKVISEKDANWPAFSHPQK